METTRHQIQSTKLWHRTITDHGPQFFIGKLSKGWGGQIDEWALAVKADANLGQLNFHLGVDERSKGFRRLYATAHSADPGQVKDYLQRAANESFRADQQPLSRTTERVMAEVLLQHMIMLDHPERSLLQNPAIARLMVRTAAGHVPSLQTNEFVHVQDQAMRPLALVS